jgi:hypothetical protein
VAVQINADNSGPTAFIGAEVLAEVTGKDVAPPPMPSASIGYTHFPPQTFSRVETGERWREGIKTQQVNVLYPIVANEAHPARAPVSYQRLQVDYTALPTRFKF